MSNLNCDSEQSEGLLNSYPYFIYPKFLNFKQIKVLHSETKTAGSISVFVFSAKKLRNEIRMAQKHWQVHVPFQKIDILQ